METDFSVSECRGNDISPISPHDRPRVRRQEDVRRDLPLPALRPKDAATLILIDRSGPVPKVLLGKRHERHRFMPGKFVFPGGGIDPSDKLMPVARELDNLAEARLMQRFHMASPARARALALAAIRETCEETGLLLGVRGETARHYRRRA